MVVKFHFTLFGYQKKQAVLGLELLKHLRSTPIVRGQEISKEIVEYREDIKQQISKLNFRGLPKH